jgi:hypothetical protein
MELRFMNFHGPVLTVTQRNAKGMGILLFFFILQKVHKNNRTAIFDIILYILHTLVTSVHEILNDICKKCFWLCMKTFRHYVLYLFIVYILVSM